MFLVKKLTLELLNVSGKKAYPGATQCFCVRMKGIWVFVLFKERTKTKQVLCIYIYIVNIRKVRKLENHLMFQTVYSGRKVSGFRNQMLLIKSIKI